MTTSRPDNSCITSPEQQFTLIRKILPKRLQPLLRGLRKRWQLMKGRDFLNRDISNLCEPYRTVYPYIQASKSRQENLIRLATIIEKNQIEGDILECGVLDGGTATLMAHATAQSGRPVHLFDAWQGLPKCAREDGAASQKWVGEVVGSQKRVIKVMKALEVDLNRLHFHCGWFHETFPRVEIPLISLLHIDCDFYEPTKLSLETWYPYVVECGFVQFDDYSEFQGCRKAVDEFLDLHPDIELKTYGEIGEAYYFMKKCII